MQWHSPQSPSLQLHWMNRKHSEQRFPVHLQHEDLVNTIYFVSVSNKPWSDLYQSPTVFIQERKGTVNMTCLLATNHLPPSFPAGWWDWTKFRKKGEKRERGRSVQLSVMLVAAAKAPFAPGCSGNLHRNAVKASVGLVASITVNGTTKMGSKHVLWRTLKRALEKGHWASFAMFIKPKEAQINGPSQGKKLYKNATQWCEWGLKGLDMLFKNPTFDCTSFL